MPDPLFDLSGKQIWVAGHTGLVGSALLRRLKNEPCEVLSVSHTDLDLTDQQKTKVWIEAHKPDAIILAAAKVGGIGANMAAPADFLYENLAIVQNVIHGAYESGVQKLLFLGSSCIYPREAAQPIKEEALLTGPLEPTNEGYALAKIAGLKLCEYYNRQYGCNFISAMPTNLYGPGDYYDTEKSHVIPALITKMHKAKIEVASEVSVWGSGKPLREFLYVDDLADALIFLLQYYDGSMPINIGSGQEYSIADTACMIAKVIGFEGEIVFDPSKPDGMLRKRLDISRLSALGWGAKTSFEQGLERACQAYREGVKDKKAA